MPAPVLIVHDNDHMREQALVALRTAGHEVIGFSDPIAALTAIEAASRVRVVVTRVNFGEGKLNGVALARMLKIKRLGVKMVFIGLAESLPFADGLGECLPMPLDIEALVEAVTRLLSQPDDVPDPNRPFLTAA
jgi:DNA-binding NtrC family response regulator